MTITDSIGTAPDTAPHPRFLKRPGGFILDALTGREIACVAVASLDTETADHVSNLFIEVLHREFGPRGGVGQ